MPNQHTDKAKELIDQNRYLTLATVNEAGQPWASPLFYAFDADYTFYFTSFKDTLHGQAIAKQSKVTAVIFDSNQPEGAFQAVYISGKVQKVPRSELPHALEIFYRRKMKLKSNVYETSKQSKDFSKESPARVYKLVPHLVWVLAEPQEENGHLRYKRVLVELA